MEEKIELKEKVLKITDMYADLIEKRLSTILEEPGKITLQEIEDIDSKIIMLNSLVTAIYKISIVSKKTVEK